MSNRRRILLAIPLGLGGLAIATWLVNRPTHDLQPRYWYTPDQFKTEVYGFLSSGELTIRGTVVQDCNRRWHRSADRVVATQDCGTAGRLTGSWTKSDNMLRNDDTGPDLVPCRKESMVCF